MCNDQSCSKSLVREYVEMFGDRSLCIFHHRKAGELRDRGL